MKMKYNLSKFLNLRPFKDPYGLPGLEDKNVAYLMTILESMNNTMFMSLIEVAAEKTRYVNEI